MYNQPSEPYNQYNQQQYGQQPYPSTGPEQAGYGQQPYPQTGPGYEQPYQQTGPDYGQQPYQQTGPGYGQYQQVPPYAQAQPMPYMMQASAMGPQKDWLVTLLLCLFLGGLGVHRFYTGHIAIGLVQLFTAGGCGIWALVDLILIIVNNYTDSYGRPLLRN